MNILITENENLNKTILDKLSRIGNVVVKNFNYEHDLIESIADIDILFIRFKIYISKKIIINAKKLKYILCASTGTNHIDIDAVKDHNIKLITLKGESAFLSSIPSTAEFTWGLMLNLIRKINFSHLDVLENKWNRNDFIGSNLSGKKYGIVGLGRVGKQVAHFAKAFNMEVRYYDHKVISKAYLKTKNLNELFKWADIISIHVDLNESSKKMINKKIFSKDNEIYLINTSRGEVWNEDDIAELIISKNIKGIATDVITNEQSQINFNPLLRLAKQRYPIIITPHIGGATYESFYITENFIVEKLINYLNK